MMTIATVLVIDDEPAVRTLVASYARAAGLGVVEAGTAAAGLAALDTARPDVVVLDIMLPDQSGWDVLRAIRRDCDALVLVLSARGGEQDRIYGLGLGADDYLPKPFSPGELLARLVALLRRARPGAPAVTAGGLVVDHESHQVLVDGQPVEVTALEFALLATLAAHPGRVFTRGQLVAAVWGADYDGAGRVVDVHMGHLRRKIGDTADAPRFIETVRGVGYRFRRSPA